MRVLGPQIEPRHFVMQLSWMKPRGGTSAAARRSSVKFALPVCGAEPAQRPFHRHGRAEVLAASTCAGNRASSPNIARPGKRAKEESHACPRDGH